jgi:hypothetical protein
MGRHIAGGVVTDRDEWEPVTEEQLEWSRQAIEQLKRDLKAAEGRPRPPVYSPGKFTEPLGLDKDGNLQKPLTPEERAHIDSLRARGRGGAAGSRGREDDPGNARRPGREGDAGDES